MSSLGRSPRARRRALRGSLALAALAGAALAVWALPGAPDVPPERFSDEPAQLLEPAAPRALSAAERREIDRTLSRFVAAGMGRRDLGTAYFLATPALRGGLTLAEWKRGEIPVYPYSARPGSSRGWELQFVDGDRAALEVFLQPGPRETLGPLTVAVDLRRLGGRWLVDGLAPTAIFSRAGEKPRVFANTDLARGDPAYQGSPRLGAAWLFAPLGAIVLAALAVPAILVLRRNHR